MMPFCKRQLLMLFVDGEYLQTEAKGLGVRNADKNKPTMAKSLVFAATETSCPNDRLSNSEIPVDGDGGWFMG